MYVCVNLVEGFSYFRMEILQKYLVIRRYICIHCHLLDVEDPRENTISFDNPNISPSFLNTPFPLTSITPIRAVLTLLLTANYQQIRIILTLVRAVIRVLLIHEIPKINWNSVIKREMIY